MNNDTLPPWLQPIDPLSTETPIVAPWPVWKTSMIRSGVTIEELPTLPPSRALQPRNNTTTGAAMELVSSLKRAMTKMLATPATVHPERAMTVLSSAALADPLNRPSHDEEGREIVYPEPYIALFDPVDHTARNVIRIISDLHLGSNWHTQTSHEALMAMLSELTSPSTCVHTLVLNGDVIEAWLFKNDQRPPTATEYFQQPIVQTVVQMLDKIARNQIRVFILRGNHDDELSAAELAEGFGPRIVVVDSPSLIINGIRITHGHEQDLFCRRDHANDLPAISYFMSRGAATAGSMQSAPDRLLQTAVQMAGPASLQVAIYFMNFRAVLEPILRKAMTVSWMDSWSNISDQSVCLRDGETLSVQDIVAEYVGVVQHARSRWGLRRAAAMLASSLAGTYGHFMHQSPYLVEIVSHTHIPMLRNFTRDRMTVNDKECPRTLDTDVVYANTGSFTHNQASFVDILMHETSLPDMSWKDGLPPYLFGQQDVRHPSAFKNLALEPPSGIVAHARGGFIGGSADDKWAVEQRGKLTLPYEVRLFQMDRDGQFELAKAKRVPFSFDWTSRQGHRATVTPRHGSAVPTFAWGDDGKMHAVPATGRMNPIAWHGPALLLEERGEESPYQVDEV
ncbi:phosphoesterase [Carpediemonas membranifera]|uniref:Phosphoesterase n=1 Tax=Carpediemonas membranifera TaxID=201153 RepID=A0A8J6BCZ8_9EUKA|nr:phosphoesterase [Carpediemonas membranifera]|eukprot:KAG9397622.1 phosphoesterase [Carpediemonas membranifera]